MNILAIVGSPRVTGNTNYLVDQALEEASRLGANIEKIILSKKNLSPCFGHLNCGKFTECREKTMACPFYRNLLELMVSSWPALFITMMLAPG